MLEFNFMFTQAWNKKLCLDSVYMPPAWWLDSRCMPPKLHYIHLSRLLMAIRWMEWRFIYEIKWKTWLGFYEIYSKNRFEFGTLFHFLISLTKDKELCSDSLFHFLMSSRHKIRDYAHGNVSFFDEVDTIKELSSYSLFHFLKRLTQDQELSSYSFGFIF